jgi:hypothetical protein
MKAVPPPGNRPRGAFASERGVQCTCGSELGSQRFIENHGATVSSKLCVTSVLGSLVVGSACGSMGNRSTQVTLLPEPGREEMNRSDGSSWPM